MVVLLLRNWISNLFIIVSLYLIPTYLLSPRLLDLTFVFFSLTHQWVRYILTHIYPMLVWDLCFYFYFFKQIFPSGELYSWQYFIFLLKHQLSFQFKATQDFCLFYKRWNLEWNHLSLSLFISSQFKILASLNGHLSLRPAVGLVAISLCSSLNTVFILAFFLQIVLYLIA